MCKEEQQVEFVDVSDTGSLANRTDLMLPMKDVGAAGLGPDGSTLFIISDTGHAIVIDADARRVSSQSDIVLPAN